MATNNNSSESWIGKSIPQFHLPGSESVHQKLLNDACPNHAVILLGAKLCFGNAATDAGRAATDAGHAVTDAAKPPVICPVDKNLKPIFDPLRNPIDLDQRKDLIYWVKPNFLPRTLDCKPVDSLPHIELHLSRPELDKYRNLQKSGL